MNSSGDFMSRSRDFRNRCRDFMNRSGNFIRRAGIPTGTSNKEADAPPKLCSQLFLKFSWQECSKRKKISAEDGTVVIWLEYYILALPMNGDPPHSYRLN